MGRQRPDLSVCSVFYRTVSRSRFNRTSILENEDACVFWLDIVGHFSRAFMRLPGHVLSPNPIHRTLVGDAFSRSGLRFLRISRAVIWQAHSAEPLVYSLQA